MKYTYLHNPPDPKAIKLSDAVPGKLYVSASAYSQYKGDLRKCFVLMCVRLDNSNQLINTETGRWYQGVSVNGVYELDVPDLEVRGIKAASLI